jgi:transposase
MIDDKLRAEIRRLHDVEKWKVGTIAKQLGVHDSTVRRVIANPSSKERASPRKRMIDDYVPLIRSTLEKYPTLTTARLLAMVKARGYPGKKSAFGEVVRSMRPKKPAEALLRLKMLPGEQAQVDWGHFGKIAIGRATHALSAFVMVLSYSRGIYLEFFLGQRHENFLRGHQNAFEHFGGVARTLVYDNLKSAVLERRDLAIRFHPVFFKFAEHHRYQPRPAAPFRGNEKGRVERAIRFIRTSFFAARPFTDLADLNRQALEWCMGPAMDRPWPEDPTKTVRIVFEEERLRLLPLPNDRFPTEERMEVVIGKTPYARFDRNDYSVPHTHVKKTLLVVADLETVRILDGREVVAVHRRSFDRRAQIEDRGHIAALEERKRRARRDRAKDRLSQAAPSSTALLTMLHQRGHALSTATKRLLKILDTFGAEALEDGCREAIKKGAPHPHAVLHIIETKRRNRGEEPILPRELPDDPRVRNIAVRPPDISAYRFDPIKDEGDENEDENACGVS